MKTTEEMQRRYEEWFSEWSREAFDDLRKYEDIDDLRQEAFIDLCKFTRAAWFAAIEHSGAPPNRTLRDYFAAKAMQIFLQNQASNMEEDAAAAYRAADAMLREREKGREA